VLHEFKTQKLSRQKILRDETLQRRSKLIRVYANLVLLHSVWNLQIFCRICGMHFSRTRCTVTWKKSMRRRD